MLELWGMRCTASWVQHCPLSCDQARCIHQPFVECYTVQAFSIVSNLDPKLVPKEQDQIPMRKVCTLIKSLVSRLPNHHTGYSQDRAKHHTLLTLMRRVNIVHDVTNVEQHELSGADVSRPLSDVTLRPWCRRHTQWPSLEHGRLRRFRVGPDEPSLSL